MSNHKQGATYIEAFLRLRRAWCGLDRPHCDCGMRCGLGWADCSLDNRNNKGDSDIMVASMTCQIDMKVQSNGDRMERWIFAENLMYWSFSITWTD